MSTRWYARTTWQRQATRVAGTVVTAVAALALVVGMTSPAQAKPPAKPGNVSGLSITSMTLDDTTYSVQADWNASANTTSYLVKLTNTSGTTLDQERVTTTSFLGTTTQSAGSKVTVSVTPFNDRRRGRTASTSGFLPDATDPVATYTVTPENSGDGNVTVTQTSLTDNVSTAAQMTQSIDWGDGSPTSSGPGTQTTFNHAYPATPAVHHPVVTVTDNAGNDSTYTLALAVQDMAAPTGTFAVSPATGWAGWTIVTVSQQTISDNLSAEADITRTVDWGDGPAEPWTSGSSLTHVYDASAVYAPSVTLTDEAGNATTPIATSDVTITTDTVAPRLRFRLPTANAKSVSKWTTLRGSARDPQTGVRNVRVKVIEKRHGTWYAYRAASGRWISAAGQGPAWHKATLSTVTPTGRRWSVPVKRLKVGLLVYRAAARDNVGNSSAWRSHQQLLTRP
jgi:hypothetical protein